MSHRLLRDLSVLVLFAIGLVGALGVQAQQAGRPESAARVRFAGGRISFVPPPGFTLLTPAELTAKYPRAGAPRNAVGNARRTTSIAYDLLDQRAPSADLEAARKFFASTYEQMFPTLRWVSNDVRRIGEREWAHLEFTAAARDQALHNIVLVSVYDGRVLIFNFNSTTAEFPSVERALRASMATITTS